MFWYALIPKEIFMFNPLATENYLEAQKAKETAIERSTTEL